MSDLGWFDSSTGPSPGSPSSSGSATLTRRQRTRWMAVHLDGLGTHLMCDTLPPGKPVSWDLPPAALLPAVRGEPVRGDVRSPPHVRGTGYPWPPEARVDAQAGCGRWPIAYAWQALAEGRAWTWQHEGRERSLKPEDAIVAALSASVLEQVRDERNVPEQIVLVVPNELTERAQQALLDRARSLGLQLRLLWRPIAAALAWLDLFQAELIQAHMSRLASANRTEVKLGRLLTLHVGVDGAEGANLSVVARQEAGLWRLLAGRHRPKAALTVYSAGRRECERLLESLAGEAPLEARWRAHWASTRLPEALEQLRAGPTPELGATWRSAVTWSESKASSFAPPLAPVFEPGPPVERILGQAAAERATAGPLLGVIVTGPLGGTRRGEVSLAEHWIAGGLRSPDLAQVRDRVRIEGADLPLGVLALGAGRFAVAIERRQAAYLDTLPQIQIAVSVAGEPQWQSLLQEGDRWVEGGRTWRRDPRFRGLVIRRHSETLDINLSHEEHPTVRMVQARLPSPPLTNLSVSLDVSVEPAQGAARVEVVPDQAGAFGRHRVWVEWSRMTDTGVGRETYLQERYPRIFPPVVPRHAHPDKWKAARSQIEDVLKLWPANAAAPPSSAALQMMHRLGSRLRELAPNFHDARTGSREATALDSDGKVPPGMSQEPVDRLVARAVPRLALVAPNSPEGERLIRMLGYMSCSDHGFESFVVERLRRAGTSLLAHEVQAAGWAVREPETIAVFAEILARRLSSDRPRGNANWLKAFSHMLRRRPDATRDISTALAAKLCELLLKAFRAELEARSGKYVFRYTCVGIVYLLRRRMFEDDFLDPGSRLAGAIKSTFQEAQGLAARKKIELIGGSIDLVGEFQRLIDYIDRHGHGLPGMADEGGGDDEGGA